MAAWWFQDFFHHSVHIGIYWDDSRFSVVFDHSVGVRMIGDFPMFPEFSVGGEVVGEQNTWIIFCGD